MLLQSCTTCEHGKVRDENSYCSKEKCFSFLTKCIQNKALACFINTDRIGCFMADGMPAVK
ncbi:MAG: hypothetical protein A2521_09575 [Deltaproteobacteria bacterium RIFOXYD12_FULL_57_12]|nr:MAG: hypothetical protein A2521_09575 [Deltaproteobacteria bacterium RIFOXYD12_FULL_57_12]